MNEGEPLPQSVIEHIYRILMEEAGAPKHWREDFILHHMEQKPSTEYRFFGKLGPGGKLWRKGLRFYVNCYTEDENPERLKIISRVNERLDELMRSI